ncbi:hypothetical protein [Schnuerera sp.]|uniref:hypothetical protein n=1 Tax=Schnuerera sp. TaxID=2794844 RepID=UPI002CA03DFF|nr:hypothetical protein [Schnuerera sp.]HSH36752.1 hypothetical protein [Schnuerera sp.]
MDYNYPELYYRIYPKAIESANKYLEENQYGGDISEEDMETMIDEIYDKMVLECPEIDEDPIERRGRYRVTQRPFYGRRRLIRDIISIILISELIRRINPYGFYGAEY